MNEEHWSSPNGCHPDCPVCAEERTVEEDLEYAASERIRNAAPELLAALEATLAYLHDHLPKGNIRESTHFRALNEHAGLCKAAHAAIAKARPVCTVHIKRRVVFRNPDFSQAALEMRTNGEQWSVVRYLPPGMDLMPDSWTWRTEEQAKNNFESQVEYLKGQGFNKVFESSFE